MVLEPVSGEVQARAAGADRYRDVEGRRRYPVGVTVDAHGGRRPADRRPRRARAASRAVFSEGKFTVTQAPEGDPVATLRLTGPADATTCDDATASARRKRRVRRLWGDGRGAFRTSGRYSAAPCAAALAHRGPLRRHRHARAARGGRGGRLRRSAQPRPPPAPPGAPPPPPSAPGAGGARGRAAGAAGDGRPAAT